MRILVGTGDTAERRRLVAILTAAKHAVLEAASPVAAAALVEQKPDLAILEAGALHVVRGVLPRIYLIALASSQPTGSEIWSAYSAGADDVMRFGAVKEEILGRCGGPDRLRHWIAGPATLTTRIRKISVLSGLENIIAGGLSELVGTTLRVTGPPSLDPITTAIVATSAIPLTLITERLICRIGLGIDAATRARIQADLLGNDTSTPALADAMREMANIAGGAIRRSAFDQGLTFTLGLPSNETLFSPQTPPTHGPASDASKSHPTKRSFFVLTDGAAHRVDCVVVISANDPRAVSAKDLREGMVLARDVLNPMGVLLVPSGAHVTRTTAEQINRLLGPTASIEVTDALSPAA